MGESGPIEESLLNPIRGRSLRLGVSKSTMPAAIPPILFTTPVVESAAAPPILFTTPVVLCAALVRQPSTMSITSTLTTPDTGDLVHSEAAEESELGLPTILGLVCERTAVASVKLEQDVEEAHEMGVGRATTVMSLLNAALFGGPLRVVDR